MIPVARIVTLAWFFFGIGPGAVIGNWIFGSPTDPSSWIFGMPSIWAWQLLFWALGVAMMYFLAYTMQMSTVPETEAESLAEDIAEIARDRERASTRRRGSGSQAAWNGGARPAPPRPPSRRAARRLDQ